MSLHLSKTFGLIRPMTRSLLLSTSTLTRFAVNGVEAALALSFTTNEYRTGNAETTFADAFTGNSPKLTYDPGSASSSQSTMVNSSGNIVWAPHNLVTYSEDQSQGTTTDDATLSGSTLTATAQSGNQFPELNRIFTVSTGTTTWWADIENLTNVSYVTMATQLFDAGAIGVSVFELGATPNVATQSANHTATITEVEPGVYRCSITFTTDGTDNAGRLGLGMSELSGLQRVIDPDGTESMDIVRQQLEVGATPSSYIPTDGSTVIRAAQTLDVPSAELGWDSAGVSFAMEGRITASDDAGDVMTLSRWMETNLQRIDTRIAWNGTLQGNVQALVYNGPSPYVASEGAGFHSVSDGVFSPYSIAWRHTSSTLQAASSGSAISNTGTPNNGVVDLSASDMTLGTDYMGTIRHFRQWDEDIGETGIEEVTS